MTTSPDQSTPSIATHIGVLTLAVMNVASVVSLGGLPSEAKYGLTAIFYYVFAAVFFLVPLGLVAAELATGIHPFVYSQAASVPVRMILARCAGEFNSQLATSQAELEQAQNLFIEDAIEQTTVAAGGVSAEFGRFSGGEIGRAHV